MSASTISVSEAGSFSKGQLYDAVSQKAQSTGA